MTWVDLLDIPEECKAQRQKKKESEELIQSLPKQKSWYGAMLCEYNGYWFHVEHMPMVLLFEKEFKARETDIVLATMPKSGTTWMKALMFSIVNRNLYPSPLKNSPLLAQNPHELIPFVEMQMFESLDDGNSLDNIPSPRIVATHSPYGVLPDSIRESLGCKIVYICRNPLDHFTSNWHFYGQNRFDPNEDILSFEEAFEMYCKGIHVDGPFWNHMSEYWNAGMQKQDKILFLTYEELKQDVVMCLKRLAEFIGFPFTEEEEMQGKIQEIATLCSFEKMKNLDVNKEGKIHNFIEKSSFYRKGEIGDWKNLLSTSMAERVEKILVEKLGGSGLNFNKYVNHLNEASA